MNKYKKIISFILTVIVTVGCTFCLDFNGTTQVLAADSKNVSQEWPVAPELSAKNVILMDADTGGILYEKNAHDKAYPASTTKILTGLLTIENCDMSEMVTFSNEASHSVAYDDANIATKTGEQYSVEQSLYALLLYSANEVAYGLAEHVAGSVSEFAKLMNARAKELGALNTHFANASGLYNPDHYTTAYDLAMIARGCYNNSTFVNIDSTSTSYTIGPTNLTNESRIFRHRHLMLKGRAYAYEYCKGGKTGYTEESGYTLVTFAEKNDMRLICVLLNCADTNIRFEETTTLFEWGFNNFKKITTSSDSLSSLFSGHNYYQSPVNSKYSESFQLNSSTLTIPNETALGDITISVDENFTPKTENDTYITQVLFKLKSNVVATSLLTFSKGTPRLDSNLPYREIQESGVDIKKRFCIEINLWLLIICVIAVVIVIMFYNSRARKKRRRYHKSRR